MNTEEKNEFDAIFALQEMHSERINFRSGVAWKLTIALWTVLSILIGTVITGRISFLNSQYILISSIIGISILSALYILYIIGMWKFDRYLSSILDDSDSRLFKLTNTKHSEKTIIRISNTNKYNKVSWGLILRIGTTLILSIGSVLAIYIAGANNC